MSEVERIVEQLKLSFDGEAWHGPGLREALADVDAQTSAARPIPTAHSIWELVLHVAAWEQAIRTRIAENRALQLRDEENFPTIPDSGVAAWQRALAHLRSTHEQLI